MFLNTMLNYTSRKFLLGFAAFVGAGALLWFAGFYFSPDARQERAALRYIQNLEEQYKNDTYGGATPEETLSLFIAALEAGDIELASKYFLPDEREEIKQNLLQASEQQGGFEGVIERVKKLNLVKKDNKEAFFTIIGLDNVIQMQATLIKNQNNTWKITDL